MFRVCNNPEPKYGGLTCKGNKSEEIVCNQFNCSEGKDMFEIRSAMCSVGSAMPIQPKFAHFRTVSNQKSIHEFFSTLLSISFVSS
jgi:hypothetical protein